jgi:spore germination protein GerM
MRSAGTHPVLGSLVRLLALVGLVLAVTGCGLSANDEPQAIEADDVPADILDPNPPTSTTLTDLPTGFVTVYLVAREGDTTRLSPVPRDVADPTSRGAAITALLEPTSDQEQQMGLSSSIPSDTVLLDTTFVQDDHELIVNLSGALFDIQGEELANAFAQLVWTVTELDGVRQVRFKVDGEAYRAPNAEGIEQDGAVTRADYSAVAPA